MKPKIIPSIIAKNQKELNERFAKVRGTSDIIHLDVMDGKFVKSKSLMFDFRLPRGKKWVAHLMVKNPESWIKKNIRKVNSVLIHVESFNSSEDIDKIIKLVKSKKKGLGLVLNPETGVMRVKSYAGKVSGFLIMTVHPGKYGAKFLSAPLKKIRQLKKLNSKLQIGVDGGMNPKNIVKARKAGADIFAVGSYLQKSDDVRKAIRELRGLVR